MPWIMITDGSVLNWHDLLVHGTGIKSMTSASIKKIARIILPTNSYSPLSGRSDQQPVSRSAGDTVSFNFRTDRPQADPEVLTANRTRFFHVANGHSRVTADMILILPAFKPCLQNLTFVIRWENIFLPSAKHNYAWRN
jgi:hypothetical protein